jgi:hypothetical protein
MSEEEKNYIREQHTDKLKVVTENFSKLMNSKSGNVKSLNEQLADKTSSTMVGLAKKVIKEQTPKSSPSDFSKFPCVAKLKDIVSPKGEKSKRGEGIFKDVLFYPNGRCMDLTNKTIGYFKCLGNGIVIGDDPNIDLNTVDANEF